MFETPEARANLRRKLETWQDDRKNHVAINQVLELLDLVERLEKEVNWLAAAQNCDVPAEEPTRCPEGKTPPDGCIGVHDCVKCWREAARKAVGEQK